MKASKIGNELLDFFSDRGLWLAPVKASYDGYTAVIALEPDNCLLSDIEAHLEQLQRDFRLVSQPAAQMSKGLIKFVLEFNKKPFDINQICLPLEQFQTLALRWQRVKISGGSEAGKSPLAANLIGLWQAKDPGIDIRLSNPTFGSKKDFWKIKTQWKDYDEALEGLLSLHEQIEARRQADIRAKLAQKPVPNHPFQLFIFDEIDNTLALAPKPRKNSDDPHYQNNLKTSFKYASHENIGIVLIGQSPYSSDMGFKQADFANLVQLHIGSNALKAIELSAEPRRIKDELIGQFRQISEHFNKLNRSVTSTKDLHRFALVQDNISAPYFVTLPMIGQFG